MKLVNVKKVLDVNLRHTHQEATVTKEAERYTCAKINMDNVAANTYNEFLLNMFGEDMKPWDENIGTSEPGSRNWTHQFAFKEAHEIQAMQDQ